MEKDLFELILDKDEIMEKTVRPVKSRAWASIVIGIIIFAIFVTPIAIGLYFDSEVSLWGFVIFLGVCLLLILITIIMMALWCNKTVYAITNKRIIIRTGFIGIDYKSLDYAMVGALVVNVNWIDKLLHKNTGTIAFGSMASPLTNQSGAKYSLSYVKEPYILYKEIKKIIDEHKAKKLDK